MEIDVENLEEWKILVPGIWELGKMRKVWLFTGEMGAGKTTLIKELCAHLDIEDHVASPTFNIVNEYSGEYEIAHFDFYRMKTEEEALDIGLYEYFERKDYCFIEWPEKITNLLPQEYCLINLEALEPEKRLLTLTLK